MTAAKFTKPRQRFERKLHAFAIQPTRRDHVPADGADGFLIVQSRRGSPRALINHEADGIRSNIDNRDRLVLRMRPSGRPRLQFGDNQADVLFLLAEARISAGSGLDA